ncbi:MurR/RpiR family transcriptional regulator [Enterococcus thailandicus]|uniref:MurR/RpiR family transcriptional regulator n=1 Tax=Enterococcus thailandicus TaxID=417368 RepID=UPI0022EC0D86|nr:MurR/RpiR family transcriptional regulator [Enterococcus thailandicus]MDA3965153.1 MurR/RpiR family transcriptional regulator [Enterococcus thailandicus]
MKRVILNYLMAIGGDEVNEDEYAILIDLVNDAEKNRHSNIQEIAKRNFVSPATVSRLCKKFGFGFREMKQFLKDEMTTLNRKNVSSEINPNYNIRQLHQVLNDSIIKTFDQIDEAELKTTIEQISLASNISILANGLSQIAGGYLSQRLQIIGKQAYFLDVGLSAGIFVNQLTHSDLVLVISRSGESPLLTNKIQIAQKLEKKTIVIGCEKSSTFGRMANHCLPIYGSKQSLDQSKQVTTYNLSVFFLIDVLINNLMEYLPS